MKAAVIVQTFRLLSSGVLKFIPTMATIAREGQGGRNGRRNNAKSVDGMKIKNLDGIFK